MSLTDLFMVLVDANAGHEDEYARWFCGEHMAQMQALPGVTATFAGRVTSLDGHPAPAQLCAVYETPDPGELLATIAATKGSAALPVPATQGRMVWRVLETLAEIRPSGAPATRPLLVCMFPEEAEGVSHRSLSELRDEAGLPLEQLRLTRIGAIQPARGREFATVLFLTLADGAAADEVARLVSERLGRDGARYLLVEPMTDC